MFSAAGAGGALIEETESGTLERVLTSGLGMTGCCSQVALPDGRSRARRSW
jgi:hypothetical protein